MQYVTNTSANYLNVLFCVACVAWQKHMDYVVRSRRRRRRRRHTFRFITITFEGMH